MILPQLLGRVTLARSKNPEDVAFLSNAALMVLDQLVFDSRHGGLVELFANRLTLSAATATSKLEGWLAREADIRDSYQLMTPGTSRPPMAIFRQFGATPCADHQPIDRAGLKDTFDKEISRDLQARLPYKSLIASGTRAPRPGAPHTFLTTKTFLTTFDLQTLRYLPELELASSDAGEEHRTDQVRGVPLPIGRALTFNQSVLSADPKAFGAGSAQLAIFVAPTPWIGTGKLSEQAS
ncbi:DUF1403 family protein [Roseobacter sp. EG26]|uniref:DUF1403 family protein n=1 Tax=Roseobacter sp. EG26 TaxID=3412477 RepID=UPI003CE5B6E5